MNKSDPELDRVVSRNTLASRWHRTLERHRWLPFVLPFALFMLSGLLEPAAPPTTAPVGQSATDEFSTPGTAEVEGEALGNPLGYPAAYVLRIALTLGGILLVLPAWRTIALRVSWLSLPAGLLGGIFWILLCRMRLEDQFLTRIGLHEWTTWGDRPAFNPIEAFGDAHVMMAAFLAVRLTALTLIVPLIEEFFLRGFLMRFVVKADWWTVPLGVVTWSGGLTVVAYAVLSHPAEPIAAGLWFTLITLLYAHTRSLWDCVVAHAITNGVLGVYILLWRDWTLW